MAADDQPAVHPATPDGRYFVVRGRLWRLSDPSLAPQRRQALVDELMAARRAVRAAKADHDGMAAARDRVDAAKHGLGDGVGVVVRWRARLQSASGGAHALCGLVCAAADVSRLTPTSPHGVLRSFTVWIGVQEGL